MTQAAQKNAGSWQQMLFAPTNILRTQRGRRLAMALGGLAAIVLAAIQLWQQLRPHIAIQPEYLVASADMVITPPPEWIHSDVKAAAIRDAALPPKLSILDERLSERISQAFLLNPWIARVEKVQTFYPARIQVNLIYRRPVAMVEVFGGLLPVDSDAVLLPTEDFSPAKAQHYPRIAGVQSSPLGPLGTAWGDPVVAAGTKLANLLASVWNDLELHRICEFQDHNGNGTRGSLELVTRGGTKFIWGAAPKLQGADEPSAGRKLDRLLQWKHDGSLDSVPPADRDLRRLTSPASEIQATPQN